MADVGNRLTKIYTRTGDDGSTGLSDGTRTPKDGARMEAIGTVDELNSTIGMVLAQDLPEPAAACLLRVQHDLFDLGGELSLPDRQLLGPDRVEYLEQQLDEFNAGLPYLQEFILPGGTPAAAACHLARTVCRRAERRLVTFAREHGSANPQLQIYLNRLSDLLFVVARVLARAEGGSEVFWHHQR